MVPTKRPIGNEQRGSVPCRSVQRVPMSRAQRWLGVELFSWLSWALVLSLMTGQLSLPVYAIQFSTAQVIELRSAAISPTQIRLTWTIRNPKPRQNIKVFRARVDDANSYESTVQLPAAAVSYIDNNLLGNTRYYYYIKTVAPGGILTSTASNVASAATFEGGPAATPKCA